MNMSSVAAGLAAAYLIAGVTHAGTAQDARDFRDFHNIEIAFHQAGSTKDLALMLSLFADDATLTSSGKTYAGKDQVKKYWQAAGPFQPQNQWVGYTPAFRIKYSVKGDTAHLYFECLWVDKLAGKIAAHTNSDDDLVRVRGRWLIRSMKAGAVPDL